jgi:hypothetical protein
MHFTRIDNSKLVLIGLLAFSPVSALISNALGFDATINEVFLILTYPFLTRKLNLKFDWISFSFTFILLFLLLFLAMLIGNYPSYSIFATFRGYFLLTLGFAFSVRSRFLMEDLKFIFLGSVLGWVYRSSELVSQIQSGNDDSLVSNGNLLGLFGLTFFLISSKYDRITSVFSLMSVSYLVLFSGSRRTVLVVLFALIIYFLLNVRKVKSWLYVLYTLIIIIFSIQYIIELLDSISPLMRYRLLDKFVTISSNESDQIRVGFFDRWISGLSAEILPSGFISKRTFDDVGAGDFMDFPLSEITKTFGLILVVPFFVVYSFKMFTYLLDHFNGFSQSSIKFAFGCVLVLFLFIEGSFLNFSFITPMTGLVLGKIFGN